MLVLIGASASGKTETAKFLMDHYGIKKIITCTTRKPREGEVNDVDYHFLSMERFEKLKEEGKFLETAFYAGNYYGTLKKDVGDNKVACVDPNGAREYRAYLKKDMFCIYLDASERMRRKRMLEKRKDAPEMVEARLKKDKEIFNQSVKDLADVVIDTEDMSVEDSAEVVYKYYSKWQKEVLKRKNTK